MVEYNNFILWHCKAASGVLGLKERVQIAAAAFDFKFNKVTNAQKVNDNL
jgi:hypothetical protein